jgi:ATP-dependent helicase Lhr and Lhr-like helicase
MERAVGPGVGLAVEPAVQLHHAIAMAPTAGGKTEAAFFPLLSRILSEDWQGHTVLYVCPLRCWRARVPPAFATDSEYRSTL